MTLVSHDHRFIFLKTHKTGGTSIEMALQPFCTVPGHPVTERTPTLISKHGIVGARLADPEMVDGSWRAHRRAEWVKEKVGDDVWNRYTKISAVRDPFDIVVSWFHFISAKREIAFRDDRAMMQRFDRFVRLKRWEDDLRIVYVGEEFAPQTVIRFERMTEDLAAVFASFGATFTPEALPHVKNTTSARRSHKVADYYTPELVEIVLERMWWIFDRFGYPQAPEGMAAAAERRDRPRPAAPDRPGRGDRAARRAARAAGAQTGDETAAAGGERPARARPGRGRGEAEGEEAEARTARRKARADRAAAAGEAGAAGAEPGAGREGRGAATRGAGRERGPGRRPDAGERRGPQAAEGSADAAATVAERRARRAAADGAPARGRRADGDAAGRPARAGGPARARAEQGTEAGGPGRPRDRRARPDRPDAAASGRGGEGSSGPE